MSAAVAVGALVAAGVFLLLRPGLLRMVLGFVMLGHGVNLLLLSTGGLWRRVPPVGGPGPQTADPLPQAFVLTAVVISFGITVYLLALLRVGGRDPDEEHGAEGPGDGGPGDGEGAR